MVAIYQPQKLVLVKTFLLQHQEKELVHQTLLCQQVKLRNLVTSVTMETFNGKFTGLLVTQEQQRSLIKPKMVKQSSQEHLRLHSLVNWLTQNGCQRIYNMVMMVNFQL